MRLRDRPRRYDFSILMTGCVILLLLVHPADAQSFSYVPTGGSATLSQPDIQARTFDPRNFGATANGSFTSIGTSYPNATVESLAATKVGTAQPFSWLTDNRAGVKFSLTLTSVTDSTHLLFTYTSTGGNTIPSVANVPQSCFQPLYPWACVIPGMVVTDTSNASATTGLTVSSSVPWPEKGVTQPSGTPGTIVLSGAETGMKANDQIQFEVPSAMLTSNYSLDWLGTRSAIQAADTVAGGGVVHFGPGAYQMGQGQLLNPCDNPVTWDGSVTTAQLNAAVITWQTDSPVGGVFAGDATANSNGPCYSVFRHLNLSGPRSSSTSFGVAPRNGSVLLLGERSSVEGVFLSNGYAGLLLYGDHHTLTSPGSTAVLYGSFRGPFGTTNGNDTYANASLQGTEAAFAASYNATMDASTWIGGEVAVQPHVFYVENPAFNSLIPATANARGGLTNSSINDLQAEEIGGAPIDLENPAASLTNNIFDLFRPSTTTLMISTESQQYLYYANSGSITNNTFRNSDPQTTGAGAWPTVSIFHANAVQSNNLGDWSYQLNFNNSVHVISADTPSAVGGNTMDNNSGLNASGNLAPGYQHVESAQSFNPDGSALADGTLVRSGQNTFPQIAELGGALDPPIGVVVQGAPSNGTALFASRGIVRISHDTSTGYAASYPLPLAVSKANPNDATYGFPLASGYVNSYGYEIGTNAAPYAAGDSFVLAALNLTSSEPLRTDYNGGVNFDAFTVAALPSSCNAGSVAFATNGRNTGEASGKGTGVDVFCHAGTAWWPFGSTTAVTQ